MVEPMDIGEALQHLENSNWVLVDAVNVAIPVQAAQQGVDPLAPVLPMNAEEPEPIFIPDDPPSFPPMMSSSSFPQMMPPLQDTFASYLNPDVAGSSRSAGVSLASDYLPLGASQRSRMLELNIEYRDRMIHLKVPDNQSIQVVKDLLLAETGVSPCQQEIRGWSANSMFPPSDRRLLSELNLPKENFLYLLTPEIPAVVAEPEPEEIIVLPSYTLTIIDLLHDKTYTLPFTGNQLVNHVKRDTSTVTGIPVFRQVWTGWPPTTQGENTLGT
ncbi:FAS-associated factor 1 [Eurytemora carolleeae]|uniref:FAS-associated factor 1 n=1 Tax=Eurytemora carolleeae TaxID=1294199 RepID=UPI000C794A55|nr:FAS-associated factor 1 [Eurytemora carolleeae]|eukprot:XP_023321566.1 FAS-associated factor 1-like [Eurytemora affinis]